MSEPTYRIDIEHRPAEPTFKWIGSVYRISDDHYLTSEIGVTEQEAVQAAFQWIKVQGEQREPYSLHADEEGRPVPGSLHVA